MTEKQLQNVNYFKNFKELTTGEYFLKKKIDEFFNYIILVGKKHFYVADGAAAIKANNTGCILRKTSKIQYYRLHITTYIGNIDV